MTQLKQCSICKKRGIGPKPIDEFKKRPAYKEGVASWCWEHQKEYQNQWRDNNRDRKKLGELRSGFKKRYGITLAFYEDLYRKQDGRCAICSRRLRSQVAVTEIIGSGKEGKRDTAHVDHCHGGQFVRGLLCSPCNTGIGQLQEDEGILLAAIEYLKRFKNAASKPSKEDADV